MTTTLMLESAECAATAHSIEKVLRDVPGVLRAYANPVTEAAYVEYDGDRCNEADLVSAVESLGIRVAHRRADDQRLSRPPWENTDA